MYQPASDGGETVHLALNDRRQGVVIRVARLDALEIRVGVLRRAAQHGMIGTERTTAKGGDFAFVDHASQVVVGERRDLRHFMRGAEPVEEMQERHPRAQRRRLGDGRHVLRFLNGVRSQHGETGLPHRHHVGMIAEDRQRVRGQGSRRDVHHERRQLAGDLVHVGDHQQQALRGREGRRQGAGLQRAVRGPRRAGFRLHLDDLEDPTPKLGRPSRHPLVRQLAHRRRRRDRIDDSQFVHPIGD